jgi:hypothetical protein
MRNFFFLILLSLIGYQTNAQGCVAIRSNGATCTMEDMEHHAQDDWIFSLNYRYFKSYKHFVGTEEQKQRVAKGTQVINYVNAFDLDLLRVLNSRWAIGVYVPVTNNIRSSLYEHDGANRHSTKSFGIGDVRFAAYYWLLDPAKHQKFNIQTGLGIKLPTGDYRYQDYFVKNDSTRILGPVDQSIQLGDGGTGITLEANAFYRFSHKAGLYANAYYLVNPREQNGVSTGRGSAVSANSIAYRSDVMSVPDQYMVRAGGNIRSGNLTLSAGMRMECVPAKDLVGGSNGFRRPGYVLSAEPVIAYKLNKAQFYLSVPYAIQRNRTQSVPDKIRTQKTGVYYQGDAAFADYTINLGLSFSLK